MERSKGLLGLQMWDATQTTNWHTFWHQFEEDVAEHTEPQKDRLYGLIAAVVQQAIDDLSPKFYRVPRPTIANPHPSKINPDTRDAFYWMFMEESQAVGSFAWCCAALDLSPRELRLKVGALHPAVCWACATECAMGLEL